MFNIDKIDIKSRKKHIISKLVKNIEKMLMSYMGRNNEDVLELIHLIVEIPFCLKYETVNQYP